MLCACTTPYESFPHALSGALGHGSVLSWKENLVHLLQTYCFVSGKASLRKLGWNSWHDRTYGSRRLDMFTNSWVSCSICFGSINPRFKSLPLSSFFSPHPLPDNSLTAFCVFNYCFYAGLDWNSIQHLPYSKLHLPCHIVNYTCHIVN